MATTKLKPRDEELFRALDSGPLTVRQILKLGETFSVPFGSERRVQDRVKILTTAGLLKRWPYLTGDCSVVFYYTLSTQSFRLLYGHDVPLRRFKSVAISRQDHTRYLAEFGVHTAVAAHASGFHLADIHRENALCLEVGAERLYPDRAFTVHAPGRPALRFFVELDNSTEPIMSAIARDSWMKKLAFYEAFQDSCGYRFRVLGVVTKSQERLDHIALTAAAVSCNPHRPLFYGIHLADYLLQERPLEDACFRNHKGKMAALIPPVREQSAALLPTALVPALTV